MPISEIEPKPPFNLKCSQKIFSEEEIAILERYGGEFERLTIGERLPKTPAQQRFVDVDSPEIGH